MGSHYNKLSKEDKKRHFPEKNGGKGDLRFRGRRGSNEVNKELDAYRNNPFWQDVEQRKERERQQKEAEARMMREEKSRLSKEIHGK